MSSYVLVDVTTYVGGFNFTTKMNSVALSNSIDELDSTVFGNGGFRSRKGGLKDVSAELAGYWDNEVDDAAFTRLGIADDAVSISPTGVEGDPAFLWRGEKFTYSGFGTIGQLAPFSLTMMGSHNQGVARGSFLKSQGNVSTTGATGTAFRIVGGIPSGFALYTHIHVFSAGTTVTGLIESDDANTFASATTRTTHAAMTAVGSYVQRVAGPLTDDWYRLRISAITGTFSVACSIGVGV